jgi:hypothetical protein
MVLLLFIQRYQAALMLEGVEEGDTPILFFNEAVDVEDLSIVAHS